MDNNTCKRIRSQPLRCRCLALIRHCNVKPGCRGVFALDLADLAQLPPVARVGSHSSPTTRAAFASAISATLTARGPVPDDRNWWHQVATRFNHHKNSDEENDEASGDEDEEDGAQTVEAGSAEVLDVFGDAASYRLQVC